MSGDDTIGGPVRMFPCRIEECYPLMCNRASATCHRQLGSYPGLWSAPPRRPPVSHQLEGTLENFLQNLRYLLDAPRIGRATGVGHVLA